MTYATYNIELTMSRTAREHWAELLMASRDAFNCCAGMVVSTKTPLSLVAVHHLCYDTLREEFPQLPAQGIIRVQKSVLSALRAIRSNKQKNADTPRKKGLSLQLDKRLYSRFTPEGIFLSNGKDSRREKCDFVLYDKVRELFSTCTFTDPTLFIREGRVFLSVPFEVPTPPVTSDDSVGVDLGMKRLFVTSEGKAFVDKEYLRERRRLRYLRRCLQSRNTRSAKRHLRKVSRRERHLSRDMVERSANVLLRSTNARVLVLEDLSGIKVKTSKTKEGYRRKRHNSALSQVPFYHFRERLTHKAQRAGRRVETVSPTWTSQTDSRTGRRDGVRHGCRYCCSDGVVLDADWNAAVNIALRASHPFPKALPYDGMLSFLSGRALSTAQSPIDV